MITKVPIRYLPKNLNRADTKKQKKMLLKSRKMYKNGKYFTRKNVASFKSKPSNHITKARKIYKIENMTPNKQLSLKTGCSLSALKKIVSKGEGAYYSSGSRPNQTPQSWGLARLARSITGGKAAAVDFNIIQEGCDHKKKAYKLAVKSKTRKNRKSKKVEL